jgi:hypothetical protein
MSSLRQIEANRINALRSTGPSTEAGKATSRFNALKTGIDAHAEIIVGEHPDDLKALADGYYARWNPRTPESRMLVDALISDEWQLRRLRRAEQSLWGYVNIGTESDHDKENPYWEGRVLYHGDQAFDRLQRRVNSIRRNAERTLKQLQGVMAAERAEEAEEAESAAAKGAEPAAPPRLQPQPAQSLESEIGFVPQRTGRGPSLAPPGAGIAPEAGAGDAQIA